MQSFLRLTGMLCGLSDEQTQAFIARLVPDEIEKFRKLLAK